MGIRLIGGTCLVLLFAFAGPGCANDGGGGQGGHTGEGGSGAGGGDEGGSGPGDSIVCSGVVCQPGETCGEALQCSCDPEADTCEVGKICLPSGRRCGHLMGAEGSPCDRAGQRDPRRHLECAHWEDRLIWLRICATSKDCFLPTTHCAGSGHCIPNPCGHQEAERPSSGARFGRCDAAAGVLHGEPGEAGACLPEGDRFWCVAAGLAAIGEACRPDGSRAHPERGCGLGLHCPANDPPAYLCQADSHCTPAQTCDLQSSRCVMRGCSEDADCGDTESYHCSVGGVCAAASLCRELCDGGAERAEGELADCDRGFCPRTEESLGQAHAILSCKMDCDPFGGPRACPAIRGNPQICRPWPHEARQRLGTCEFSFGTPAEFGEDCSGRVCESGSTCVGFQGAWQCLQLCCEETSPENACPASTLSCPDRKPCMPLWNSKWGACAP